MIGARRAAGLLGLITIIIIIIIISPMCHMISSECSAPAELALISIHVRRLSKKIALSRSHFWQCVLSSLETACPELDTPLKAQTERANKM